MGCVPHQCNLVPCCGPQCKREEQCGPTCLEPKWPAAFPPASAAQSAFGTAVGHVCWPCLGCGLTTHNTTTACMQAGSTVGIHNDCTTIRPSHIPLTTADAEAAGTNHRGFKHNKCCRLCSWVPLVAGVAAHSSSSSRLVLHNHHMIGGRNCCLQPWCARVR